MRYAYPSIIYFEVNVNDRKDEKKSTVTKFDVDQMDFDEISALRQKLDGVLDNMMRKKRHDAQDKIRELAAGLNVSVSELLSDMPEVFEAADKKPKNKLKPKYRSVDTIEEWSGRGRTPKWVLKYVGVEKLDRDDPAHLEKLEELKIKS